MSLLQVSKPLWTSVSAPRHHLWNDKVKGGIEPEPYI
jgi:hypothetical protein